MPKESKHMLMRYKPAGKASISFDVLRQATVDKVINVHMGQQYSLRELLDGGWQVSSSNGIAMHPLSSIPGGRAQRAVPLPLEMRLPVMDGYVSAEPYVGYQQFGDGTRGIFFGFVVGTDGPVYVITSGEKTSQSSPAPVSSPSSPIPAGSR